MAASKEFLEYVSDQLSEICGITYKQMMGEYIVYLNGKIAAYICDDRLLLKPVPSAEAMLPNAPHEPPYDGAKEMLLVEEVDNKEFLTDLFNAVYDDLPEPKPKRKR